MTTNGWLQILCFSACVLLVTKPLGVYLTHVYDGSIRFLAPLERILYRLSGVDPDEDQHWTRYAASLLLFSAVTMLLTYMVLRLQHLMPLNPQAFPAVTDRQAFETSASFTSNTNWQSYSGESMMSYFSQMTQLAFHNFVSAAVGMAVAVGLIRGLARRGDEARGRIGNFWTDLVRGTLYVLVPVSLVLALVLVHQGVIQNFKSYLTVTTLEGAKQNSRDGPCSEPRGHQTAWHQRRRILQRQLGAPIRESHAVVQFLGDVAHLHYPLSAHLHARPDGSKSTSWLGGVGRHVRSLLRRCDGNVLGGIAW